MIEDEFNIMPIWVRIAVFFGFPSAVAAILLAALLGAIPSPMTQMLILLAAQNQTLTNHSMETAAQRDEIRQQLQYQNIILRSICRGIVPSQNQSQCEPSYQGYQELRRGP